MALDHGYKLKGPQGGNKGEIPKGRPFRFQGVDYPADWIARGGTLPGVASIEAFDNRPPPPGPPTVWSVPLHVVLARLNQAQRGAFCTALDGLASDVRWGLTAAGGVMSDDTAMRALISSLQGSPDPDVILAR